MPHNCPLSLSTLLIDQQTVTPVAPGAMQFFVNILENIGFSCQLLPFDDLDGQPTENLFATIGSGSPHLLFAGHMDVVPTGDTALWSSPPFKATEHNNMLVGRGTSDMKCAIACFVAAVARLKESESLPQGTISLLITGDEEGNSINGTRKALAALKDKGISFDAALVGEPTSVEKLGDMVKVGRRGSVMFHVTITGKQGHVAYPHLANNPITALNHLITALTKEPLDHGTEFFDASNLEVVNIAGGEGVDNVIPHSATATINIRFNDSYTSDKLISWFSDHCHAIASQCNVACDFTKRVSGESFLSTPGAFCDIVTNAIKENTGIDATRSTTGGTSDARFIKDYAPTVELGMLNATAHQIDEAVSLDDIESLCSIYQTIIKQFA